MTTQPPYAAGTTEMRTRSSAAPGRWDDLDGLSSTDAVVRAATAEQPARLWVMLSPSCKAALEYAVALSHDDVVHTEHLLLGLYAKSDGPTRRFLDQSGVSEARLHEALVESVEVAVPGQVTPIGLQALPAVSRHVATALRQAAAFADELGSSVVRSRHLFYGLLAVQNCEVTRALVGLKVTAGRYRAWLRPSSGMVPEQGDPEDSEHPSHPQNDGLEPAARSLHAGGISADLVDPDKGIPKYKNDLEVWTYVEMIAAAIARTDTKLPLSIGLFGEWGSGKSYFMGLLREQVAKLASCDDEAYHAKIVQITFNAWSYADANLWASLGDEIFRELAGPAGGDQDDQDRATRPRSCVTRGRSSA